MRKYSISLQGYNHTPVYNVMYPTSNCTSENKPHSSKQATLCGSGIASFYKRSGQTQLWKLSYAHVIMITTLTLPQSPITYK